MNHRAAIQRWALTAILALAALPAAAGTVSGVVSNGTTNRVAAATGVTLIQLQGGMQPIAQTTTDSQGHFSFSNPGIGQQPMLLRASYHGVDYLEPIPPGQPNPTINIAVYEPTADTSAFQVLHQIVAIEPQNGSLMVGEEFDIENQTKPPKSYFRPTGSFEFDLPKGADLNQVEAWGPSGMPVVQATVGKGPNQYDIIFPFRPGQNGVRFSYKLDYPGNQATLDLRSPYPVQTAMLLAPPAVTVNAAGFSPAGNEHGWSVYTRQGMKADTAALLSLSGTGPIPTDTGDANGSGQDQQDQPGAGQAGSDNGATVTPVAQAMPPRLDSVRWIVISGFGAMFLLGAFFLWWKSKASPAIAGAPAARPAAAPPAPPLQPPSQPSPRSDSREGALRQSVDDIKETLFRLELRRQAGTISEQEYSAQRGKMEQALRELVRG